MVTYENECVGCPTEMGCWGSSCPNRNVPHLYCDECEEEVDELYRYTTNVTVYELCADCLLSKFPKIDY